jgi:hypothetical protein
MFGAIHLLVPGHLAAQRKEEVRFWIELIAVLKLDINPSNLIICILYLEMITVSEER